MICVLRYCSTVITWFIQLKEERAHAKLLQRNTWFMLQLEAERAQAELLQRNTWFISYSRRRRESAGRLVAVLYMVHILQLEAERVHNCCSVIHGSYQLEAEHMRFVAV